MSTRNATIERDYLFAQRSFATLAAGFSDDEWATPVPCCPGWTVRDVLSHVAGIPDDVLAGRLDGVATDPWTAAQVERNRDLAVADLLARWNDQTPGFAAAMQSMHAGPTADRSASRTNTTCATRWADRATVTTTSSRPPRTR